MSHVDNIILSFSIMEASVENDFGPDYCVMARINGWLLEHASGQRFGPDLGYHFASYGGRKGLETPLYIAAFNYLPEDEFVAFLRTLPWREPENAQLLIKRQHEDRFVVLSVGGEASA